MKAIVLSCDRYIKLAEHMIRTYQHLWPENPFQFIIPYNHNYPQDLKEKFDDKVEFIKTKENIKPTVLELIKDIPDEELVYWCIDDKCLPGCNRRHWCKRCSPVPFLPGLPVPLHSKNGQIRIHSTPAEREIKANKYH